MSEIKVNAITNAAGGNTATINGMTPTADSLQGFRNRIINGGMVIDQRNAGASVTPTNGQYLVDRWFAILSQASKFSAQQNAGSVTPPAGFTNYQGVTSLSAYSVLAGDFFGVSQKLEGFNCADFGWGTASAQAVTISFWVRSSLTGTFGGSVQNNAFNRSYPFTYTITSANTWEQKTVTIAGDTSGTWLTNSSTGIAVIFGLGVGSTYSGTAGTWASANYVSATGAVSVVGTSGATFYITGVQLEAGSVATPFERRPYGTELALCQRYFASFLGSSNYSRVGIGVANTTTSAAIGISAPVSMRTAPTISYSGSVALYDGSSVTSVTGFSADHPDVVYSTVLANVSSGLTQTRTYQLLANGSTTARVTLSAEL